LAFTIQYTDNKTSARTGILTTPHGTIETPIFMPVGTAGAVKAVHHKNLKDDIHAQIILGNTYHLYLRPGISVLTKAGGLHRFSGWDKPILTDSGGYQVYSLAHRRKLNPEGVVFQSHIDGSRHHFTPEYVIDIQRAIGADIMMAFDECTPFPCDREYAEKSLEITHQWLGRCMQRYNETQCSYGYHQELFPIVQGSVYRDLRKFSAETIASYPSGGYAIGGLSVGEPAEVMYEMTELVCGILPREKPRYLMGVGTPVNILENIALGIDMFDCVMPTRNGRNGMIFTAQGIINIRNEKWKNDFSLLDEEDTCFVDRQYSKAYLRHLFISNEMNGPMIVSMHNLAFYLWLMKQARLHIAEGTFASWKTVMIKQLSTRL
jgi:queuine tRNA-ribosyltransferase